MKSLVIYYSHYGNTALVLHRIWSALSKNGEADIVELGYAGGKKNIFTRFFYRIFPSLVKLKDVPLDLKNYDVLCLGIPVLGAHPSSAILKYLNTCKNIYDKKIICCYIYGVEASAKHCAKTVNDIIKKRGSSVKAELFISWMNVHKEDFLNKAINGVIAKIS